MPCRVILIDDHQSILDGLQAILANQKEIEVVEIFTNPLEALSFLKVNDVNLVLTDLDMGEANGEDVLTYVKEKFEDIKVIVLSMHNETSVIKHLIQLGADGYLVKSSGKEEIIKAIETVYNGGKYFSDDVMQSLTQPEQSAAPNLNLKDLTKREIEIIELIAEGLSNKEIAAKLFISVRTAETHRTNIMKKLDLKGAVGIVRFAYEQGLMK